jgi:phenylalanyl-tRNA synthetase beta chain
VMLRNPLSEEWSALRPSLLPGLLQSLDFNIRRGQENVFLGEVGWVHARSNRSGEPQDRLLVAGVMRGSRWMNGWNLPQSALTTDFYATRGVVEAIAADLRLPPLSWSRSQHPFLHPGRGAAVALREVCLGALGQIHPAVAAELDVPGDTFVFELDAQTLMQTSADEHRYVPPSRFPTLSRDLAVVVARDMPAASVAAVIARAGGELARSVRLFDVYHGGTLPQDRVSLAFSLELSAPDRTLTDAEADELLTRVRTALRNECGGDFR